MKVKVVIREEQWFFFWCAAAYIATRVVTGSPWLAFVAAVVTGLFLERDLNNHRKKVKR